MRVRTTPGGATKPGACSGNEMVNTRVCAGRRPRLTLHGSVHKNIANISYCGLVDRMFTEAEGKSPWWFRRSSECWSSSEGSLDGMIVERMVREHQGNLLSTVSDYTLASWMASRLQTRDACCRSS